MKNGICTKSKLIKSSLAFCISFVLTFGSVFTNLPGTFTALAAGSNMSGVIECWRFDSGQWVSANSQTYSQAEGEWIPVQAKLTGIQQDHPNLSGLKFEIDFTFTKNGARFFDFIRCVQASDKVTMAGNKLVYPLDNPAVSYPDANGNAWDLSTRENIENAQNNAYDYWWDQPIGNMDTGFHPIVFGRDLDGNGTVGNIASEIPLSQINVPLANDLTDEANEKTINGVQGFSYDDEDHRFYITGEQLIAAGIDPTANSIVVYFQLHLSRSAVWSQGLTKYFAQSKAYLGGWMYDNEPYLSTDDPTIPNNLEINTSNGSGLAPGASAHISYGTATLTSNAQIQFPPVETPDGTISGYKWEDVNGDGLRQPLGNDGIVSDDDELPLAGWPVTVVANLAGVYVPLKTVYTDANGAYMITMLTNNINYYISEDASLPQWYQTYPIATSNPTSDTNPNALAIANISAFNIQGNPPVAPNESPGTEIPATQQQIASYVQYALLMGLSGDGTSPISWAKWGWDVILSYSTTGGGTTSQANINFGNGITPPSIDVSKSALPSSVSEYGGALTYTYKITNTGHSTVTVTSIVDDKFSNMLAVAEAAWVAQGKTLPIVLNATESFSFNYNTSLASDTLTPHTNVVTVTAVDEHGLVAADNSTETVTFMDEKPLVDIVKSANPVMLPEPGGTFTFTLLITNNSLEAVTITSLSDTNPEALATIVPYIGTVLGAGQSISINYNTSETEAGSYSNTASVTVRDNEGNYASDTDAETVTVADTLPVVDITKSANPLVISEPGGQFVFTITLTNESLEPVTITSLTDSDPNAAAALALFPNTVLQPNESKIISYTSSHTEAGTYYNTASVTVQDDEGNSASDIDTETVMVLDMLPIIDIAKSANVSSLPEPGGLFTYTLFIQNNSVEPVTITSLTDTSPEAASVILPYIGRVMLPGEIITLNYSISHTEAGQYSNTAAITVRDNEGNIASDSDTEIVSVSDENPIVDIDKTALVPNLPEPGGIFTYRLTVTNNSIEPVTIVSLTDTSPEAENAIRPYIGTVLQPDQSITVFYNVTHTEAGIYNNIAEVKVTDNEGNQASDIDTETVTVTDIRPAVDIVKSAASIVIPEPGGLFNFSLVITNNSVEAITLTGLTDTVTVAHPELLPTINSVVGLTLVPGQSITVNYLVPYFMAGSYLNTATVTAQDNEGNIVSDTDFETVTVSDVLPVVNIEKSVDRTSVPEPGGVFNYTLTITNYSVGPVIITGLTDTDPEAILAIAPYINSVLAPGASISVMYPVLHTEAGSYSNTASVTVRDTEGNLASDSDSQIVTVTDELPILYIDKSCATPMIEEPNATFTYQITITNGSPEAVTITNIIDTNPEAVAAIAPYINSTLLPGAHITIFYTVTHADVGLYPNLATVTGRDNENNYVTDSDNENVTVVDVLPMVTIDKSVDNPVLPEPGGAFVYRVVITNKSVEPVTIIDLVDTNSEAAPVFAPYINTVMLPGQRIEIDYSVTKTEAGSYSNLATVTVRDNEGNTASDTDNETVTVTDMKPVVNIEKSANPLFISEPGGSFTYTLVITNNSAETVTITDLTDTNPEAQAAIAPYLHTALLPNQSITITYNAIENEAGTYNNTATVTVQDNELNTASDSDSEAVTVTDLTPVVDITKSATPISMSEPGGAFQYTLVISNNCPEQFTITNLTDSNQSAATVLAPYINTVLQPGAHITIRYTASESEAGAYSNTAAVTVRDNEGNIASDADTEIVTVVDALPIIDIAKSAVPISIGEPGGTFQFTLVVTNSTAEAVTITKFTDTNADAASALVSYIGTSLQSGQSLTVQYNVSQIEAGEYPNTATVEVADNEGNLASDSDLETVTVTDTLPVVDIKKSVSPLSHNEPGGEFAFTLVVTNNSVEAVTITNITDTNVEAASAITPFIGTVLLPDASATITYKTSHTEAGLYPNTAEVTVMDNEQNYASDIDSENALVTDVIPIIDIKKSATPASVTEPGGKFDFTLAITNNSPENVTITALTDTISEAASALAPYIGTVMKPGDIITINYSASYSEAGEYVNTATVMVKDNENNMATDSDTATVTVKDEPPVVDIEKTVYPLSLPEGGAFAFTLVVTNNGVESFTIKELTDTSSEAATAIAPYIGTVIESGKSITIQYNVTHLQAGTYSNTASVTVKDNEGNETTDTDTVTVTVTEVPKTGDNSNVNFAFVLLGASLLMAVVSLNKRKSISEKL